MGYCTGRGGVNGDHCCYLSGRVCDYLVDNKTPGDGRFRCGLYLNLGSWEKVHADPRYVTIGEHFNVNPGGEGLCGDWQPNAGQCCREVR